MSAFKTVIAGEQLLVTGRGPRFESSIVLPLAENVHRGRRSRSTWIRGVRAHEQSTQNNGEAGDSAIATGFCDVRKKRYGYGRADGSESKVKRMPGL
jgi:hypothetical protein